MVTRQVRSANMGPSRWLLLAAALLAVLAACAGAAEPTPAPPAAAGVSEDRPHRRPTYTLYHTDTGSGAADNAAQLGGADGGAEDGAAAVVDRPEESGLSGGSGRADHAPGDAGGDYPSDGGDAGMNGSASDDDPPTGAAGGGAAGEVSTGTGEGDDTDDPDGGDVVDVSDGGTVGEDSGDDDEVAGADGGGAVDLSDGGEAEAGAEDGSEGAGVEAAIAGMRLVVDGVGGVLVEGPCGWRGPVCPLGGGTDPIDAGGPLLASLLPWEDWRSAAWVGRVLDLCDDHEALVALDKGWFIGASTSIDYSAAIPSEAMEFVYAERRRHPVSCSAEPPAPLWKCWGDGSGRNKLRLYEYVSGFAEPPEPSEVIAWAESVGMECWDAAAAGVRYVYMTANGPLLPQSSVEAAVEDYLERAALAGDEHGGLTRGLPLGARYPFYAYPVESPEDSLFVLPKSVSVRDGALRGLAQNRSERLWARDVTVTATGPDGAAGESRWPLTVQPGELLPFEINDWPGPQTPSEIDIAITADLSPTIDLTRSLELWWHTYYETKGAYLLWDNFPEEMGAYPYGTAAFNEKDDDDLIEWTLIRMRRKGSSAHPRLGEAAEEQTIENLTVYAALLAVSPPAVIEVWEMTPMNRFPSRNFSNLPDKAEEQSSSRGWVEAPTITTLVHDWDAFWEEEEANPGSGLWYWNSPIGDSAAVGFVGDPRFVFIWAGGAAADTRPPGDAAR